MPPNRARLSPANHIPSAVEETRLESDEDVRHSSSGMDRGGNPAIILKVQANR
jgi:hypothetical protein